MPTLIRLISTIVVIVLCAYGAMFAVATFLEPEPRAIAQTVVLPQDVNVRSGRSAATNLEQRARMLTDARRDR